MFNISKWKAFHRHPKTTNTVAVKTESFLGCCLQGAAGKAVSTVSLQPPQHTCSYAKCRQALWWCLSQLPSCCCVVFNDVLNIQHISTLLGRLAKDTWSGTWPEWLRKLRNNLRTVGVPTEILTRGHSRYHCYRHLNLPCPNYQLISIQNQQFLQQEEWCADPAVCKWSFTGGGAKPCKKYDVTPRCGETI